MEKTILIIGAGREQIPAFQVAKDMGLKIVATDMNPDAPAFQFADFKLLASTRDVEESLAVVKRFASDHPLDGVFTIANDVPLTVAVIANQLGLPGIRVESAKVLSDKSQMKKRFLESNIRTAPYREVSREEDIVDFVREFGFPIVLKPVDGRGSRGVLFIHSFDEISSAFNHTKSQTHREKLLVEKFLLGSQMSVESIFIKNQYIPIAFADRNYSKLEKYRPFIVEDGGVMPTREKPEIVSEVSELVEHAARALGVSWGTVKADIVVTDEGPSIIELAGRLSGGYLSTFDIPKVYGVNIIEAVIQLSMGCDVSEILPLPQKNICSRYVFPENPGVIKKFTFPVIDDDNVFIEKFCHVGESVSSVGDVNCKAGMVRVLSDTKEEAEELAEKIIRGVTIVTE